MAMRDHCVGVGGPWMCLCKDVSEWRIGYRGALESKNNGIYFETRIIFSLEANKYMYVIGIKGIIQLNMTEFFENYALS